MQIPKLLRSLAMASMYVFSFSCIASVIFGVLYQPKGGSLLDLPLPLLLAELLAAAAFIAMLGGFIGSILARSLENAGLRRLGQYATAQVLDYRYTGERDNRDPVVRIKLQVLPPGGEPFEAVAEDVLSMLDMSSLVSGSMVPVRYDPATKEVALVKPKRAKQEDF